MNAAPQKSFFQLCFPLFLHSLLSFAVVLIDTMIISAWSGRAAAAVNIGNQVLQIAYEFSALMGVGGVILIAHSLGRGDERQAREIAAVAVLANAAVGLLIALVLAVFSPWVLVWINTPEDIYSDTLLYVRLCCVSLTFNGFMLAAVACLRGFGHTKTILVLSLFSQTFYLGLEYVLILGWGPIEGMGVLGSGLGRLTLRVVSCLVLVAVLWRLGVSLRVDVSAGEIRARVKRLLALSFPSVSDNVAYGLYQLVLIGFIAGMGVATVLSRAYTMIANSFLTLVIMVVSKGNEVFIGYQAGAGRLDDAYRRALRSSFIAMALATGLSLILYLLADKFIGLFTDDPEVHAISAQLLFLTVFLQPVYAFNTILFHSLKAVGDVNWPVVVSQTITWCISLPLAYVVSVRMGQGVAGIWWVLIAEETLKSVCMFYRWNARTWFRYSLA